MMNELKLPQIFITLKRLMTIDLRSGTLMLLFLLFSQNIIFAEGSVDFRNDAGKRIFYWANEQQQIKVFAKTGEYLNIGASHIGLGGGHVIIYKPDGSFAGIYQNFGFSSGLGIINNDTEELNGPTGGGTVNGSGYVPITQPILSGEEGVWTVIFSFPSALPSDAPYSFTNLENTESWDRATHQPNEWAIVAWDVTVSNTAAANNGGTMMTGRVFTNEYKGVISGTTNSTSPTFYTLTKDGTQYQMDFDAMHPERFTMVANAAGIVSGDGQPTFSSKTSSGYAISDDPTSWAAGNFYIYNPQGKENDAFVSHKIFFNTPDTNMPSTAVSTDIYAGETYTTWLYNSVNSSAFSAPDFTFTALDAMGNPTCINTNVEVGYGGKMSFTSNVSGTVKLMLDINGDGDFVDNEDRTIYQNAIAGANEIDWDGKDGNGTLLTLSSGYEINYQVEMRAGEIHVLLDDVENINGGMTITRMNGMNAPDNSFFFDHTEVGGTTSGGAAPAVTATTTPHTYNSNFGNTKTLDYWSYLEVDGNETGKMIVHIVSDCSKPVLIDSDFDGVVDDVDLDDDNDGIPDAEEYCNVAGGFACFDNSLDPSGDADADLVPNFMDADDAMVNNPCVDANTDGICDTVAAIYDNDGDGVADHLDLDSDNDGIPDLVEAGHGMTDVDENAQIDGAPSDFGMNGLYNAISSDPDAPAATITYFLFDTDNNNIPDFDDLDADGDGLFDVVESPQVDGDFDGIVGTGTPKVDAHGLPFEDGNGMVVNIIFEPKDLDEDGLFDYNDWDRDGDGIADSYECPDQTDCIDSDNDSNFDIDELDSDGDGISDMDECPTGLPCPDLDGNMVDDFREIGCPTFNVPTVVAVDEVICEGELISLSTTAVVASGVFYEWFYNNGTTNYSLGITNSPNYFVNFSNPSHTGAYAVQVKAGACSSQVSNAVNITVYSTSTPVATNTTSQTTPLCEGENVQLTVPFMMDATYEWFGPDNFSSTLYDPVITGVTPDNAGSYYAVVTASNGCATLISTNTTVFVQATPAPPGVDDVNPVCSGGDLILEANPIGVPPNATVTYEWFYQNGNSIGTTTDDEFTIPNVTAAQAGEYYVVMMVGNCIAAPSEMVQVTVTDTETPQAGADISTCGLGNTALNATMPSTGLGVWTSPTGATIFDDENPQSNITNLTIGENIFVWSLSNDNCFSYATDTVIVTYADATQDIANAGVDVGLCGDGTAILGATSPATAFGIWTQPMIQSQAGITISNNTSPTPTIEGMVPGNSYVFTWILSEGTCFNYDADEIMVTISETPNQNANVILEEKYTCGDDEVALAATVPTIGTGSWSTPTGATVANPSTALTTADDLTVGANLFIWSLSNGACQNYDADSMVVFVEEDIDVNNDEYTIGLNERLENQDLMANDVIGFVNEYEVNLVEEPSKGTVQMTDGIFTYIPNHNAYGVDEFEYEICNVNCENDCVKGRITITINGLTEQGECWIPNVLTPNGNGKNDALIIPCTENFPNNELIVFNRWGDQVFKANGYSNDWEGTYNDKDLPAGTYYYIFKLDDNGADAKQGFFTIVR